MGSGFISEPILKQCFSFWYWSPSNGAVRAVRWPFPQDQWLVRLCLFMGLRSPQGLLRWTAKQWKYDRLTAVNYLQWAQQRIGWTRETAPHHWQPRRSNASYYASCPIPFDFFPCANTGLSVTIKLLFSYLQFCTVKWHVSVAGELNQRVLKNYK